MNRASASDMQLLIVSRLVSRGWWSRVLSDIWTADSLPLVGVLARNCSTNPIFSALVNLYAQQYLRRHGATRLWTILSPVVENPTVVTSLITM